MSRSVLVPEIKNNHQIVLLVLPQLAAPAPDGLMQPTRIRLSSERRFRRLSSNSPLPARYGLRLGHPPRPWLRVWSQPLSQANPSFESSVAALRSSHVSSLSRLPLKFIHGNIASAFTTFDDLRYESDVNADVKDGRARFVDKTPFETSYELWAELLDLRSRIDGHEGIKDIWRGMCRRDVTLHRFDNNCCRLLRNAFVSTALRNEDERFLEEICQYSRKERDRSGRSWRGLFVPVMDHFLRHKPVKAIFWAEKLASIGAGGSGEWPRLVDAAVSSREAQEVFESLYLKMGDRNIYDAMIRTLCAQHRTADALFWHYLLLKVNDVPSNMSVVTSLRRSKLLHNKVALEHFEQSLAAARIPIDVSSRLRKIERKEPVTREEVNESIGRAYGIKPMKITDGFVARVFATKSFSLDFAIGVLATFGLKKLGPLAMRELAVRCASLSDILNRMKQLKECNIGLDDSVYVQAILKLAIDGKQSLLRSVLESDQHPDVFADKQIQWKMLQSYIAQEDWTQAERSLHILSTFHGASPVRTWNIILKGCIESLDYTMIDRVLDEMLQLRVSVNPQTIKVSFFTILRPRRPCHRPVTDPDKFDDLRYLTNMWLKILRGGMHVPASAWKQVLIHYGTQARFLELERLTVWLAHLYARQDGCSRLREGIPGSHGLSDRLVKRKSEGNRYYDKKGVPPLQQIFDRNTIRALVEWGFKGLGMPEWHRLFDSPVTDESIVNKAREESIPWARGIYLLRTLRQCGVPVHVGVVAGVCRQRLRMLFSPKRSNRKENRVAARKNTSNLASMVDEINRAWGSPTFTVSQEVLENPRALYRAVLGDVMPPDRKIRSRLAARNGVFSVAREHVPSTSPAPCRGEIEPPEIAPAAAVPKGREDAWQLQSLDG